jgi:hypothetical protein
MLSMLKAFEESLNEKTAENAVFKQENAVLAETVEQYERRMADVNSLLTSVQEDISSKNLMIQKLEEFIQSPNSQVFLGQMLGEERDQGETKGGHFEESRPKESKLSEERKFGRWRSKGDFELNPKINDAL